MEKYTGHPGPWFCPQLGLLVALEHFFPLQNKENISYVAVQSIFQWTEKKKSVKTRHYQVHTFWGFSSIPSLPYPYPQDGHRFRKLFNEHLCSQNCTLLINMHASAKLLSFALYKLFLTAYFPLFKQTMTFVTRKYISRRKVILWQKGPIF